MRDNTVLTTTDRAKAEAVRDWLIYEAWIEAKIRRRKRPLKYLVGGKLFAVVVPASEVAAAREALSQMES